MKLLHFSMLFAAVAMLAPVAFGQTQQKNELGLLLGSSSVANSPSLPGGRTLDVGHGLTFGLSYAHMWTMSKQVSLGVEVPFEAVPSVDVSSSDPATARNYAFIFVTPGVRVRFRSEATVRPWLSVGGGYARFDESSSLVTGLPNSASRGTNSGAAQFGAGLDIRTPIKVLFPVGARLELRDFYTGKPRLNPNQDSGRQNTLIFSGGITLHF
ncbi:MAG TPA: hypothetical protein VFL42_15180 [Terriglobales bacterium]|jgi:hypothetical protein|nr:hypothetical protein [Terriglobales bacterium]